MSINLTIAVALIFIIMMIVIIKNVKNKKLQLSYSIFWIVTGLILIIVLLIPGCLANITKFLGFEITSNMIFFITIAMAFYLILELMTTLSKESKRNVNLVQEISMLKKRVDELEKNMEKDNGK